MAGYTDNVPRIFASNGLHGAHQIARARYGYQLEDSMEHMRATVDRAWDTVLDMSGFLPPRIASPQGELF